MHIKSKSILVILMVTAAMLACSGKKTESSAHEAWPEMDAFHMRMAEVYHPFKDSANLAPAKEMADLLADEADKWSTSKLPSKVDNDVIKQKLKSLNDGTKAFAEHVKDKTTDEALGKELTSLHENFHSIMEAYHGGGDKH